MQLSNIISCFIVMILVQDCLSLTMLGLFHQLKMRQRSIGFPDEAAVERREIAEATSDSLKKSYIRPIGSVAGQAIIPRRWTTKDIIDDVFVDENGIAFPVRHYNPMNSLRGGRNGLY